MKRKNGFTLIELLVVVAIIAVLIALLLPALSNARNHAKTVVDMANIKTLSAAVFSYAGDWNGWAPDTTWTSARSWANILTIYKYTPDGQKRTNEAPKGTYICPSQLNSELAFGLTSDPYPEIPPVFAANLGSNWRSTHYGLNAKFTWDASTLHESAARKKLDSVEKTSYVFLISDIADRGRGMCLSPVISFQTLSLRHGAYNRCNMAMVDGHIEGLKPMNYELSRWSDGD
jgi:prepilin-type N-terminal cleavage/methylation domain-containing protein/prepilin-type processing-associated H-X9-DG protein